MSTAGRLRDSELRRITRQVIPQGASEPFGAYLFRNGEPGAELGRHVEQTVFLEAFGNTPEQLTDEYRRYESSSVFICVLDQMRGLPAGVMRVLLPSPAGFKSFNDIEPVWGEPAEAIVGRTGIALDEKRTWDIATLAVDADYRGKATMGLVSMGLYQTLTLTARNCGIDWFVAILDVPVLRMLRWKLHMIFAGYKGVSAMPYLGSPASMPAWCDVIEAERRLRERDPDLHAVLVKGTGLEPALRRIDLSCTESLVA
ncbi:MAG TPA: hypothetical protein VMR97_06530 [Acidimicrobiales bacterium]|nr:hypothetical protein [Acidimicrobiales bacterium]